MRCETTNQHHKLLCWIDEISFPFKVHVPICAFCAERSLAFLYIMCIRNSHPRSIIHYQCCRLRGGIHDVVTLIVSRIKHADTTATAPYYIIAY